MSLPRLSIVPHSKILVVGGSPAPCTPDLLTSLASAHSLIIACDSALDICHEAQVVPQVAVGDFDSVSQPTLSWVCQKGVQVISSHWHKDETDLGMALRMIHESLYGSAPRDVLEDLSEQHISSRFWVPHKALVPGIEVTLTSCSGGRLDHQLAIIGKLVEYAHLFPQVVENTMHAALMHARYRHRLTTKLEDQYKTASPIALTPQATLSLTGFEWELKHQSFTLLDMGDLAGTSNIITAPQAVVEVHEGALVFMVNNMIEMDKLNDLGLIKH